MTSLVAVALLGALVINEVLYDPSGNDSGREFVELFNSGMDPVALDEVQLEGADGARPQDWFPVWEGKPQLLPPGGFFVVGGESIAVREALLTRSLQNGPDALRLRIGDQVVDRLGYGALTVPELFEGLPAADVTGQSLARIPDGVDSDDNSVDFQAATPTPGWNNAALRNWSVTLRLTDPTRLWPQRRLSATVGLRNTGLEPLESGAWQLRAQILPVFGEPYRDPLQFGSPQALEIVGQARPLAPGESLLVDLSWSGELGLHILRVEAGGVDEDSLDNRVEAYVRVGAGPVVVNEILFAPDPGAPEWVELWNRDQRSHDVNGWTLGDASGTRARLSSAQPLAADGYAVASADSSQALGGFTGTGQRIAARPWPSLNNVDGDRGFAEALILRDSLQVIQDALFYSSSLLTGRGRSIERLLPDPDVHGLLWTASKDPAGATPGRRNSAIGPPALQSKLVLEPNPFSPDGDGVDDLLAIAIELPAGSTGFRARIFDDSGRQRRELAADRLGPGPRHFVWDGNDEEGVICATGFYILHFEWFGNSGRQRRLQAIGLVRP